MPEGATAHSQSRSAAEDGDSRCAGELGIARSDDAGADPGELQRLLSLLASVATIYIVEDSLDPLEVLYRAARCTDDRGFSLRMALHSFAARAHAGRCLAVMQAFGRRVGFIGRPVLLDFRHAAPFGRQN